MGTVSIIVLLLRVIVEAFKPEIQKLLRRLCENVPREEEDLSAFVRT
jgi:hypothetical protein